MFTTEQRDWVKDFMTKGEMVAPPEEEEDVETRDQQGLDEIDIMIEEAQGEDGPSYGGQNGRDGDGLGLVSAGNATAMTCSGKFHNGTGDVLTLVQGSLDIDDGELTELPDAELEPDGKTRFAAENDAIPIPIPFLGQVAPFGIEGHIKYMFPDDETSITLHFDNPRFEKWGKVNAEAILEGPKAGDYKATATAGGGNKAIFEFEVTGKGGPVPPKPGPKPGPETEQQTSCLITISNQTGHVLSLDDQQNELGDFMINPATTIAPGASPQFAYVGTPHGEEPGCKGFCKYIIGNPPVGTWRMDWSNPVGAKNTVTAQAESTGEMFHSLEQIGQGDENVPVTFTLSGGPPGGNQPVPVTPEQPFAPPPKSKQPTLRQGDTSPDGWVEYLQTALMTHNENVTVDGKFGPGTHKAVLSFQTKMKLLVDGVVGNQTWAALRDGTPEAPSTDGRAPHSFKEVGQEARFYTERDPAFYNASLDTLFLNIISVGDATQLKGRLITVRLTPPGSKARVISAPIGDGIALGSTEQGSLFSGELAGMTKAHPSTPPGAPANLYMVEAYLEQDLGGDNWQGNPKMG